MSSFVRALLCLSFCSVAAVRSSCIVNAEEPMPIATSESEPAVSETAVGIRETRERPIIVRTQLVEVSVSKMRQLGMDMALLDGKKVLDGQQVLEGKADAKHFRGIIEALRSNGVARILSAPTLTTMPGTPASISVGSSVDTAGKPGGEGEAEAKFMEIDTQLQLVPHLIEHQRVRIELSLEFSDLAKMKGPEQDEARRRRYHEINTAIEVNLGTTMLLARSLGELPADDDETVALIVLVTPDLANLPTADQAPERLGQSPSEADHVR